MIQSLRDFANNNVHLDADICVVGAGAAGITVAQEFIGLKTRVLLLESGGLKREADTDLLSQGESVGIPYYGLQEGRSRGFGGTTKLWDGQLVRLNDIDFEPRSWVPHSGWPITIADLEPFYVRAEELFGVSGVDYDGQIWQKFNIQPPAFDKKKLDYGFGVFTRYLDFSKLYRKVLERSANVRLLLHATAAKIHTNRSVSAVKHLEVRTPEGKTGRVTAKAFVLCSGGIENARLLLLSNESEKKGLGNRHDLVGRFYQDHPTAFSGTLQTNSPVAVQRPYSFLYKSGILYWPKIPLSEEVQRTQQVLNCTSMLFYEYSADSGLNALRETYRAVKARRLPKNMSRHVLHMIKGFDQIAATTYRRYMKGIYTASPPSLIRLQVQLEQAPNPSSRISLSHNRDPLGLNQARVDWRLTDLELRTAQVLTTTIDSEFRRLRLARFCAADWLANYDNWANNFQDVYHHMGTTRMADDPKDGVVNSDCQVHGIRGLYVAGSSVFPTSGYANPTLTIVALALRVADHLKATV